MARAKRSMVMIPILGAFACLRAQSPQPVVRGAQAAVSSTVDAALQVIREIDDPATGNRWLLVRDWNRPGGPGRLLLLPDSRRAAQPGPARNGPIAASASAGEEELAAPSAPVIHAGDALIVEESTPIVEARLAATALGPAAPGAAFEARLEIGGKLVHVRALAPGRAALEPARDVQP